MTELVEDGGREFHGDDSRKCLRSARPRERAGVRERKRERESERKGKEREKVVR